MSSCIIRECIILIKLIPSYHQPHSHLSITAESLPHLGEVADKKFHVIKGCMKYRSMPFYILCTSLEGLKDFFNVLKLLPIISYKSVFTKLLPVIFYPGHNFLALL